MSVIRFEGAPPEQKSGRFHPSRKLHEEIAAALRANPGEWGVIAEPSVRSQASSLAHRVSHGVLTVYRPAGTFEAKARTVGDGTHRVYARYIGPNGEHA